MKQQIADMAMNASGIRDTARVLHVSPTTVINELKKEPELQPVNHGVLASLNPEQVAVKSGVRMSWKHVVGSAPSSTKCGAMCAAKRIRVGCGTPLITTRGRCWRASITASATFGHSASPDNGTCWHIMALQGAMQVYVKYFDNFFHHNPLYSHHL